MSDSATAEAVGGRRRARMIWSILPALPPGMVVLALFFMPVVLMASLSLRPNDDGLIGDGVTLDSYREFFTDQLTLQAMLRTLLLSASVGALVTLLSLPIAYFLARTTSRWRGVLLALSLAPELSGVVLRTYGWLVILNRDGIINRALLSLGIIQTPLPLLNSFVGVLTGLVHVLLPFGVLSLYTVFQNLDPNLERASSILGASNAATLREIVLPLALPGLVSSFFLAFTLSASAYATPALLGGVKFQVLATLIYQQLLDFVNWPFASAIANVLLVMIVFMALIGNRLETGVRARLHG